MSIWKKMELAGPVWLKERGISVKERGISVKSALVKKKLEGKSALGYYTYISVFKDGIKWTLQK